MSALISFIEQRVTSAMLGKTKPDKFQKAFNEDENKIIIEDWIKDSDQRVLVVYYNGDKVSATPKIPKALSKKSVLFMKPKDFMDMLTLEDLQKKVLCFELSEHHLAQLQLISSEVFFPLLSNPLNRSTWSGPTSKEVMLKFSSFLANLTITVGQSRGQTLLPPPPPEAFDEDFLPEKERANLLETSVIQWIEKIEAVLSSDPESNLASFPDPPTEVAFWKAKQQDLKSLTDQLDGETVTKVHTALVGMSNAFAKSIEDIKARVAVALDQVSDTIKVLRTCDKIFSCICEELEMTTLENSFPNVFLTLVLVWQNSKVYNTKQRLTVIIQEICNALIEQCKKQVSGEIIFRNIDDDNVAEAVHLLKSVVGLMTKFKSSFRMGQRRADKVVAKGAWDVADSAIFMRLDAFIERCNDILDFTKIVTEFKRLEAIFLGGNKGESLTQDLRTIQKDFFVAVGHFQRVPYDIMDITVARFDDDFYKYRSAVKELERRLAAALNSCFEDCGNTTARFKLLESFDGVLERPVIKDEMEKKQGQLLSAYVEDLRNVQELFHTYKNKPKMDANMPPVAGALAWCRSLSERIREPMDRLSNFIRSSDREEAKEIERVHNSIVEQLSEFSSSKLEEFRVNIDSVSDEKLKQPLLRREQQRDNTKGRLQVNFDETLVRLLKEVKYFLLMQVVVPERAKGIFERAEMYRQQVANLDMIVNMYNEIMETLHIVERPLVEKDIIHIDQIVERGIAELDWTKPNVNEFVAECLETVNKTYGKVKVMRENMSQIKKIMADFSAVPLVDRKTKPQTPGDFEESLRKLWTVRSTLLGEHQETVSRLLQETGDILQCSKNAPIWRAYVEYVQDQVRDGLAMTIMTSIKFLCDQLDPVNIQKNNLPPLLEIKLGLYGNEVHYNTDDSDKGQEQSNRRNRRDVWQIVNDWVEGFFEIGNIMSRMDGSHYVGDLKKNDGIIKAINTLRRHSDWNMKECETYRQEYLKYEFLWKSDRNVEFLKFMILCQSVAKKEGAESDAPKAEKREDDFGQEEGKEESADDILPLDKFEGKIVYYKEMQGEVENKKISHDLGWLRVNSQPLKSALITWTSRWVHMFTNHLYTDIIKKVSGLDTLIEKVNEGLKQEVPRGDSDALMVVLGYIHQVRTKKSSTLKMFQPLRDTVTLLKKFGKNLDDNETRLLSEAPMKWEGTCAMVDKVKEKVNELQNDEMDKIKQKVDDFAKELNDFRAGFKKTAPFKYEFSVEDAYECIYDYHGRLADLEKRAVKLVELEQVFELTVSKHRQIHKTRMENKLLKGVWDMVSSVKYQFDDWRMTLWDDIDTDELLAECKKIQKQIAGMSNEVRNWDLYVGLNNEVKNLLTVLPLVNALHNPCMEDRHWRELKRATGKQFNKDASFCLANVLELQLHKHVNDVEYIVELATKEAKINANLKKIEANWARLQLEFGRHKGSDIPIIMAPDEVLVALEENMASLQGMQGQGKYVEFFIDQVMQWLKSLGTAEAVLIDWLEVQGKWGSLEAIFLGSKDIRVQLPDDSKRFDEIDTNWKQLMEASKNTPNVIDATGAKGRQELLTKMKSGLEQCEKSLFQYLETKRIAFPRFYFLANAALLDLLSNGHIPQAVQKHLGDCFDNIASLKFLGPQPAGDVQHDENDAAYKKTKTAVGMYSKEGDEYVELTQEFFANGAVEEWLNRLVEAMRDTLREILNRAKFTADHWEIEKPRQKWLFDYPAQLALTASQIIWTEEVGAQFDAMADGNEQAMKEYLKLLIGRLELLIGLVLGELSFCDRIKVITLITVDVHNRDVVSKLIDGKVQDVSAFAWQSQMRFVWKADTKDALVKVCDATFTYLYEYVGNTGRLVITPLTDRCYITLTQALRLIMGGAPAGPAGTGKTETTKDLGRALGLPVYVFNCSEQMNVQSMGAVFKGLCQTGAWGCFDEFNRIAIEVLSVVSTQFASVLNAIREKRDEFEFMGEVIRIFHTIGAFITMNPGYAGRTELPENLKALFRSCAMCVPDFELICENMLMSEGFLTAQRLAKKFVTLYKLSSELLSLQRHYDWGLRAFKAVLRVAGRMKRAEPTATEDVILMKALRDFNIPKLVDDDKPIFLQLIEDLFPGLSGIKRKLDAVLMDALRKTAIERKLQPEEMFIYKCVEYSELLVIRHSVFVVGPPACGKSELWRTTAGALTKVDHKTVFEFLNPKAVKNNELYGWLTKTDWHDGLLSTIMRNMSRQNPPFNSTQKYKWLILDGDIDPEWIESLNTVMDDNKTLTLVSNERIPVTGSMRLVFEISNLNNATPATVSRAGIIFINARDVGYKPFLDSWVDAREDEKQKSSLLALFNKYLTPEYLQEMRVAFKRVVPCSEVNIVQCLCRLLEGLMEAMSKGKKERAQSGEGLLDAAAEKELFESLFAFGCIWAFGGALIVDKSQDMRKEFSEFWRRVFPTIKFPKEGTVFDYKCDPKTGRMIPWTELLPAYDPPADAYLVTKVFVPIVDSVRTKYIMDLFVMRGYPVLLVGTAGTGKTVMTQDYLKGLPEHMLFCTINLNYYTDAKTLQRIMEGVIDKRSGRIFGPPATKKLIYVLDDLNMPQVDTYGTQAPLALIKQHMDYKAWYDTVKLEKKEIHDTQYIACMNPTAGSFQVQDRLQGMFYTMACLLPNSANLQYVYGAIMHHHFKSFHKSVQELTEALVLATIQLHDNVSMKFQPSTKKFHYQFNLRDLSAIFQGLSMSKERYNADQIVKLWMHESTRVFADRLVSLEDLEEYDKLLKPKAKQHFKDLSEWKVPPVDPKNPAPAPTGEPLLLYTSFASGLNIYYPVPDFEFLRTCLVGKLAEYNESNPVMNLELFGMAMEHVCRIVRIIEHPRGNALLVGVGGSGKQSLAKLASFICGYDVFQISVTQSYGLSDLKADLQDLYRKAGVKNIAITFLLTDSQIVNDQWLVYVNDLLSSGYIPDLFNAEDKDAIFGALRNEAKAAGVADNRDAMQAFFISKVRQNLHLVLCFSPVGEAFRIRCRKFPAIINCTAIDWFHAWPRDALVSVGARFLQDVELNPPELIKYISEHMAEVHLSVNSASERYLAMERRYNYTTPKSYLELIAFFKKVLGEKRAALGVKIERLSKGIRTLQKTQTDVAKLQDDLAVKLVQVSEKEDAAKILIDKAKIDGDIVAKEEAIATAEAAKAKIVADAADAIAAECKIELDRALPILEAAKEAVKCLTKSALTVMKSFTQPPGNVLYVTRAVQLMFGQKDTDWKGAQKMMKDVGAFMTQLEKFDASSQLNDAIIAKVKPILDQPFFNATDMKGASEAAANICGWVCASAQYYDAYKNIAPKMAAQKKAQEEYDTAMAKLKVVEDRVAVMQKKLGVVKAAEKAAKDELDQVQAESTACKQRLALAKRLVDGLASEGVRWGKNIKDLNEQGRTMTGDCMLAAAFVSYIGAFNQKFRLSLWKDLWTPDMNNRNIPLTPGVDPLFVLADASDFAKWKNEGLGADRASLENGAIITQSSRWPLMIDPQLQGIKWIKSRVKGLKSLQLSQRRWMSTLTNAIQNGEFVMIESIGEEIDATLDPVLSRAYFMRGREKKLKLGAEEITYDDGFKLILQTKLSNPHYKPEIAAQCTLINFIVTEEGLEDQILALVVNKEKPELEESRTRLVRQLNEFQVSLNDLENELLYRLSNAPDDILSDIALIEGLEKTKVASVDIEQKVELAKKAEITINIARNEFRAVAAEASWLYFLLIQLCIVDYMYQFSLNAFLGFFTKAMDRAKRADNVAERVVYLRESIRIIIFTWVNRGLFEMHKLIFSSQLCFKLMQKGALSEKVDPNHFDFLIRAPKKIGAEKKIDWLPLSAWYAIQKLIELPGFERLASDMEASPNRFREWYNKARPETTPLPLDWRKLDDSNPFMKMLVVRAMRQDRMTSAMAHYLLGALPNGKAYVECDAGKSFLDVLSLSLDETTPETPIFFILSSGADPIFSLETIAKSKKYQMYDGRFTRVALGQGQDIVAMNRLNVAVKEGHWVVLENIHLMPTWNMELEKTLDLFAQEGAHPDFRVFLSAEPSTGIPIGILERSIKLTNEPPQGLKANIKRAFATFDKEEFEFKDPKVKSILFGLCHFHSVIIERIKYGPKGWNRKYPFSTGDLLNSVTVLTNYLENAGDKIPWKDLRYIFGDILYGGHITDDWDRLLCSSFLEYYLKEELLDEMEMFPYNENYPDDKFRSPPVLAYDQYFEYVDVELLVESPVAFGLHPNAEIAVKTTQSDELFRNIMELQPRTGGGEGGGDGGGGNKTRDVLSGIVDKIKSIKYSIDDLCTAVAEDRGPYQNVFIQECDRMNILVIELLRSLAELDLGLTGELQMSERMEVLQRALYLGRVPATWEKLAYPSMRSLATWVENLVARAAQLSGWTEDPLNVPMVVQITYFFNPQSFLTAIMQRTAQKQKMELDKLMIMTEVTRKSAEQMDARARDGAYVTGFYLDGARWNWNAGTLEECLPREMNVAMPVVNCRAILGEKLEKTGVYRCPVYKTMMRGPTYVFTATLRTKNPANKWVLAGVVMCMEVEE